MSFLRLGVKCAVIDSEKRILLSRREDLRIWNLPGGRLDSGELMEQAAAREVLEETGIKVEITRAVGLYYWHNWGRMNILFEAHPIGGKLARNTGETLDNRYFAPDEIPENILSTDYVEHIQAEKPPAPQIVQLPWRTLQVMRARLGIRWIRNLLSGRPEPRFNRFNVWSVGMIYDSTQVQLLTLPDKSARVLPGVQCNGRSAPWIQLAEYARRFCPTNLSFHWVGACQDVVADTVEFVFAATTQELQLHNGAEWSALHNLSLAGNDAEYPRSVQGNYALSPVWMIQHQPENVP
jgi:ADP-ribose pyrophosphatase YjhB (NUDIX family)